MKKELLIQFSVMIGALLLASILAPILQRAQKNINPDRDTLTSAPVGGYHKVISDWEWMGFINYLGKLQVVDETNVKEVTDRLERLIGLDPKYERLYLDGLSSIRHADPRKTVEMLEKACRLDYLKDNWKIPFYTGFIYSRNTYDIKDQNGAPLLEANHAKAAEYFRMAIERSGGNPENHLVNNYIRELAKAEAVGTDPDAEYLAKLRILYREWRKANAMDVVSADMKKNPPSEFSPSQGMTGSLIPDLQDRLLKAVQEAKNPVDVFDRRFEPGKELLALIEKIKKDVFYGQNLCPQCLTQAQPGEKFCSRCGMKLPSQRGICLKCQAVLKPGAAFCTECGESVPAEGATVPPASSPENPAVRDASQPPAKPQ